MYLLTIISIAGKWYSFTALVIEKTLVQQFGLTGIYRSISIHNLVVAFRNYLYRMKSIFQPIRDTGIRIECR